MAFSQVSYFVSKGENVMNLLLQNGTDRELTDLRVRFAADCPQWIQPKSEVTANLAAYGLSDAIRKSSLMLDVPFTVSGGGVGDSQFNIELLVGQEVLGTFKVLLTSAGRNGGTSSFLSKASAAAEESESLMQGEAQASIPAGFALSPNYPNPFNPTTRIAYSIPTAQFVSLKVYDLLGRHIRVLISGDVRAGSHTVSWNGTDDGGRAVPSGVYIYRLTTQNFVSTKKMIVVR